MNNLRFIREDSGLTLRELADLIGISYSLLSQMESGKRSISSKSSEMLQEFFRVTADFVEDDSNYGIYCETEDEKEKFEILSLTEYKTQRALGNVKINPRYKHPPFTDEEMKEMKEVFTDIDIEHMALMRKQPFVRRLIKNPETLKSSPAIESKRGEIARLVANMSEEQLDGVLVMLKEVIPKIK